MRRRNLGLVSGAAILCGFALGTPASAQQVWQKRPGGWQLLVRQAH